MPPSQAPSVADRIPSALRFPLVVVLSFAISLGLRSLAVPLGYYQFAAASRDLQSWEAIAGFVGWKTVELAVGWTLGWGYDDLAALTILINQPYYYLLHSFWAVDLIPTGISLIIDVISVALPFYLLRGATRYPTRSANPNQAIARDGTVLVITCALGTVVYGLTFFLSYYANLGVFLIRHFDSIPSLDKAHDQNFVGMLHMFLLSGVAATYFLFRPAVAEPSRPALTEPKAVEDKPAFNPERATLLDTVSYNLGLYGVGWSRRAEVFAWRTLILALGTLANTLVRVYSTVEGTDVVGSLGYGGLWAAAGTMVGFAFAWLGDEQ